MPVVFDFSVCRWQRVQNESTFLGVNMNLHLQPLCAAKPVTHSTALLWLGFCWVCITMFSQDWVSKCSKRQAQICTWLSQKADLSTLGFFNKIWQPKTGHAHLYRLTTAAFLISFPQHTVLVPPGFVQVTTERRCPHTLYDLPSLNERLAWKKDGWFHTSRTTRHRQWYNSSSTAFPNILPTKKYWNSA